MATPTEISDPLLRVMWQNTKKAAEKQAKTKKQSKQYKVLSAKFNLDLGPNLKKWPGWYPDLGRMENEKVKLETTIGKYTKFVKDEKPNLDNSIVKILNDGLTDLSQHLANRKAIAESLLMSNEDLALASALKQSKKKPLKPVVVFQTRDMSEIIMKMVAPAARDFVTINEMNLEVILSDDKVLSKADDANGDMGLKIKEKADFAQLKKDIAVAYFAAAKTVKADPEKFNAANSTFETAFAKAIQDATGRASQELNRLAGIRVEYRNYKIVSGVKLGLAIAGTTAGAASLAMAPFTGPAMIVSAAGVLKGAKVIGDQLADLSMGAEQMIKELQTDVANLQKRYSDWKGAGIGTAEVGSTLVNAIAPTILPTIKRCDSHCGTANSKINGLEVKAGDLSIKLNKTLEAQTLANDNITKWIQSNKEAVVGDVKTSASKLMTAMKENRKAVSNLINQIIKLNERIELARSDLKKIDAKIKALSAREPTIAKFTEVFIEIGASVGFLTSANVGWPDAYAITETAKAVSDMVGNISGSIDGAIGAAEEMKGFVDDMRG